MAYSPSPIRRDSVISQAAQEICRVIEAERLALADRARYLADPDFVMAPIAGLLDPSYLAERRRLIDPDRAQANVAAGTPPNTRQGAYGRDTTHEASGTSQVSIVDDDGNAFSMTTSPSPAPSCSSIWARLS